jgi:hypothetical protein
MVIQALTDGGAIASQENPTINNAIFRGNRARATDFQTDKRSPIASTKVRDAGENISDC